MRKILLLLLIISTIVFPIIANAEQPKLEISKSTIAIKVTDPARQVTAFEPLISRIDALMGNLKPGAKNFSDILNTGIEGLHKIPGVNYTGNFWIIVDFAQEPVMDADDNNPPVPPKPKIAFLLPLANAEQFRGFSKNGNLPSVQVFDDYAVVGTEKEMQEYSGVDTAIELQSKRDIVVTMHLSENQFPGLEGNPMLGPLSAMLKPLSDMLNEMVKNQQSSEVGLAMVGDNLSMESFITPKPGSPLANSIANQQSTTIPVTFAGYLPENLALCSASGPMLEGSPGSGYVITKLLFSLLAAFGEPESGKVLLEKFDDLSAQCKNGRAIGLTVPPADLSNEATLVGVYQTNTQRPAPDTVREFVKALINAKDSLMGGALTEILNIEIEPNIETINKAEVDLLTIAIAPPGPEIAFAGHIAYLDDKMLVALGGDSRKEITDLISRVKDGGNGFTSSKRFLSLKVPVGARGFESFVPLDMCLAGASLVPVGQDMKSQIAKFFSIFPAPRTAISDYQEVRDGCLYSEVIIPGEQVDFIGTLIKAVVALRPAQSPQNEKQQKEMLLRENLSEIRNALESFYADTGTYPETLMGLVKVNGTPNGANGKPVTKGTYMGPYLDPDAPGALYGIPRNPLASPNDTKLANHWKYDNKRGTIISAVKGTSSDGEPYTNF